MDIKEVEPDGVKEAGLLYITCGNCHKMLLVIKGSETICDQCQTYNVIGVLK